jgi:hypothetical protein
MVENRIRQMSKKTWYKWSLYINVILFFIVALFVTLLVRDCWLNRNNVEQFWISASRNVAFIAIALAFIFYQFFRNLFTIIKRSL